MILRTVFATLLAVLSLHGCSTDKVAQAGGDDMGNFVRATLLDSTGAPLHGRIAAFSDVDTFSLELDADGVLALPARRRAWLVVRTPSGSAFLLHGPRDSGALQAMRLAAPRPLVGWLRRIALLRIAGVGTTTSAGGLFRFSSVPPGTMLLEAWSDSFSASAPLSTTAFDQDAQRLDSFVVAPLVVASSSLVTAGRDDTSACGASCQWLWTSANLGADTSWRRAQTSPTDTFRLLSVTSVTIPDTSLLVSVDSVGDLGNWLLLVVRVRGTGEPRLHRPDADSVAGSATPHALVLGASLTVDTTMIGSPDSVRVHKVALPRPAGTIFADSLLIQHRTVLGIAPTSRAATGDTCDASDATRARLCGGPPTWFYRP